MNLRPTLEGKLIVLEPLEERHVEGLRAAAADERVWTWMMTTDVEAWIAARARGDRHVPLRRHPRRRGGRLDELPERRPRAPPPRDREHLEQPVHVGHGREHRGEVPAPPPRLREARHVPRRVQDRREERPRPRGAGRDPLRVRGDPPQAHGRPRRRAPRLGLVRGDRRRLAAGEGRARAEDRAAEIRLLRCPVPPAGLEQAK